MYTFSLDFFIYKNFTLKYFDIKIMNKTKKIECVTTKYFLNLLIDIERHI